MAKYSFVGHFHYYFLQVVLLCLFYLWCFQWRFCLCLFRCFLCYFFPTRFSRFLTAFRTFLPCATCWCCFLNTICHCRATFTRDCFRNGCYAKKALITKELHKPMVAKRCQLILFMSSLLSMYHSRQADEGYAENAKICLPLVPSYRAQGSVVIACAEPPLSEFLVGSNFCHFDSCYSPFYVLIYCSLVYVQLLIFSIILSKKVALKFQILLQLSYFSDDSYYTKVEESFFTRKHSKIKRICHFASDFQPNSLISINKSSKC